MIYLTKTGIFFENHYAKQSEKYVYREVDGVVSFLTEQIEIQEGFTLGDFFELVEKEKFLIETVFGCHLGHFPLQPYLDDIKKVCPLDDRSDLDYLECYLAAEQFDYKLFYEENKDKECGIFGAPSKPDEDSKNEISIGVGFHGWGTYEPIDGEVFNEEKPPTHCGYAIEFTPLYKMKHLPIKLDKEFTMKDKNEMGSDSKNIVEGEMDFTVFEVFGEILSEISFSGSPKDRDEEWKGIQEDVDDMKGEQNDKQNDNSDDTNYN